MRHQKKRHKLGRTAPHRNATLAALGNALIQHKRITTTVTKAKALRVYIEPLITRAKEDTSHNRRQVFRRLHDNASVSELFTEVSAQVGDRPGGYTRVVKLGQRAGDGAPMAIIELVDYNDVQPEGTRSGGKRTRRGGGKGRRRGGRSRRSDADATKVTAATEADIETADTVDEPADTESTDANEAKAGAESSPEVEESSEAGVQEDQEASADAEATTETNVETTSRRGEPDASIETAVEEDPASDDADLTADKDEDEAAQAEFESAVSTPSSDTAGAEEEEEEEEDEDEADKTNK